MKINLFSQYLYPAVVVRFPQLCQRWVTGFGVSPNGVVSPKGVVSLNGGVSPWGHRDIGTAHGDTGLWDYVP